MEQNIQQNMSQRVSLPIKTEIVALWLKGLGILAGIAGFVMLILSPFNEFDQGTAREVALPASIILAIGLFLHRSGRRLLKKEKGAWMFSIIITELLGLGALFVIVFTHPFSHTGRFIFLVQFIIPPIFLLLDRKNFMKVAQ